MLFNINFFMSLCPMFYIGNCMANNSKSLYQRSLFPLNFEMAVLVHFVFKCQLPNWGFVNKDFT